MKKSSNSLTLAGLFLKIMAFIVIIESLGYYRQTKDGGATIFMELFGIGLFVVAWKMQNDLKEWARLCCWGFTLLAGSYFILSYAIKTLSYSHTSNPQVLEFLIGGCFLGVFLYLNQPRVKRLFCYK